MKTNRKELFNLEVRDLKRNEQLVCNYCLEKTDTLPDGFGCQSCIDNYK
tara:strand:- start:339 stop:485 length:147 start_codon:yes stop_codon:yes gene_type:complete